MKILVVGDVIHDVFVECQECRIAQEAPSLCVDVDMNKIIRPGGAALVCQNLKLLAPDGGEGIRLLTHNGTITTKTRYLQNDRLLFRVDYSTLMTQNTKVLQAKLEADLLECIRDYDAVIIADYGKGVITQRVLNACNGARNLILDPHPSRIPYNCAVTTYLPNWREWEMNKKVLLDYKKGNVIVTMDRDGVWLPGKNRTFPSLNDRPRTVIGAGGAFCAAFAIAQYRPRWKRMLANQVIFALEYTAIAMASPLSCIPSRERVTLFKKDFYNKEDCET